MLICHCVIRMVHCWWCFYPREIPVRVRFWETRLCLRQWWVELMMMMLPLTCCWDIAVKVDSHLWCSSLLCLKTWIDSNQNDWNARKRRASLMTSTVVICVLHWICPLVSTSSTHAYEKIQVQCVEVSSWGDDFCEIWSNMDLHGVSLVLVLRSVSEGNGCTVFGGYDRPVKDCPYWMASPATSVHLLRSTCCYHESGELAFAPDIPLPQLSQAHKSEKNTSVLYVAHVSMNYRKSFRCCESISNSMAYTVIVWYCCEDMKHVQGYLRTLVLSCFSRQASSTLDTQEP